MCVIALLCPPLAALPLSTALPFQARSRIQGLGLVVGATYGPGQSQGPSWYPTSGYCAGGPYPVGA